MKIFQLYPDGIPICDPQWNISYQPNHEPDWLARLAEFESQLSVVTARLEAAEKDAANVRAWADAVPIEAIKLLVDALDPSVGVNANLSESKAHKDVSRWLAAITTQKGKV